MKKVVRRTSWVLGIVLFLTVLGVGAVHCSLKHGVGPLAHYKVEIGDEKRPLRVSLHRLYVAWGRAYEREQALKNGELVAERKLNWREAAQRGPTKKRVAAKIDETAIPVTYKPSLVDAIVAFHMGHETP